MPLIAVSTRFVNELITEVISSLNSGKTAPKTLLTFPKLFVKSVPPPGSSGNCGKLGKVGTTVSTVCNNDIAWVRKFNSAATEFRNAVKNPSRPLSCDPPSRFVRTSSSGTSIGRFGRPGRVGIVGKVGKVGIVGIVGKVGTVGSDGKVGIRPPPPPSPASTPSLAPIIKICTFPEYTLC